MAIFHFRPDGTHNEVIPANGEYFTLEEMQGYVGGYIEFALVRGDNDTLGMVVNEEGMLLGLPLNEIASILSQQGFIFGSVLYGPLAAFTGPEDRED